MSTWKRLLLIGVVTAGACVDATSGDEAPKADERETSRSEQRSAVDAGSSSQDSGTGTPRTVRDAGRDRDASTRREIPVSSEPDAEADSDLDAGFPELAAPILRDCTETRRCETELPTSLEECIAVSTSALARATPEARQRFADIIMRCSTQRGCDYVSCTRQQ